MPFGLRTPVSPSNHVLHGSPCAAAMGPYVKLLWQLVNSAYPHILLHHIYLLNILHWYYYLIVRTLLVFNDIQIGKDSITRKWANAQRDGRPAECRWRPLFNAATFGWRPLLQCRAVTLPRRETRWNLLGCPKLANRSQPLVGLNSPYCEDTWGGIAV